MTGASVPTIIFLDFDGVIWPIGSMGDVDVPEVVKRPFEHLDLVVSRASGAAVANLRTLAQDIQGQFVLISTWRKVFPPEFIQECLARLNLWGCFHEDWQAPFRFTSHKAHDIADWLGDHQSVRRPECLAIDDELLNLRDIRQITPESRVGFSEADLTECLEHVRNAIVARTAPEALRQSVRIVAKGRLKQDRSV